MHTERITIGYIRVNRVMYTRFSIGIPDTEPPIVESKPLLDY